MNDPRPLTGIHFRKQPIAFHPWIYFGIFLASNTLLSYFSLPLITRLWIGIIGVILPFLLALWTILEKPSKKSPPPNPSPFPGILSGQSPPLWLWVLFAALLLGTRLYKLTSLPFWPIADEGIIGILGINQSHQWQWNLLWTEVRLEPMIIWILGIYFKIIEPSFFALRLLPALLSIGTVYMSYWAARRYFSTSTSFIFCWFFSFSFWQFTLSRFCSPVILVPLFQILCFAWLGIFLTTTGQAAKWKPLWTLSFLAGIGFYTWTNWLSVWLSLTAVFFIVTLFNQKKIKLFFMVFIFVTVLSVIPLALARLSAGGMSHIQSLISFTSLKPLLDYINGLFWDGSNSFPYGSNWGGFFNPILASLAFLGVLYLLETSRRNFIFFGVTCILISILPGALTKSVEMYRIIPLFPFLTLLAAMGINSLSPSPGKPLASLGIAVLMLGSFGLDAFNYSVHYSDIKNIPSLHQWRNVQYADAYQILDRLRRQEGPLYVFSEFNTDYDNKTLNIACYPFDAAQNPSLFESNPKWAALILNCNYTAHLIKSFPRMKFKVLKTDKRNPGDPPPFGLFIIPVSDIPASRLAGWITADRFYRERDLQIKNKSPDESWALTADTLVPLRDQFPGDPLLISVYWEKIGFFKFLGGRFFEAAEAFQKGITLGIPAAQLYNNLGVCYKIMGREAEAKINFKKAESLSGKIY